MKCILGTRGSDLARAQTNLVRTELQTRFSEVSFIEQVVKTLGDSKQGTPAANHGDKRDWIHELELELLSGRIDIAVHSGKDIPVEIHTDTVLVPVLARDYPGDVFIGKLKPDGTRIRLTDLQTGNVVGTASKRRQAQLKRMIPGLVVVDHRGNVPTRLRKLEESSMLSGIVLAHAGLERLSLFDEQMECIACNEMLPAVNQGILVVQCRASDADLIEKVKTLTDAVVTACFTAERSCMSLLDADCKSAVGVYAKAQCGTDLLTINAHVYSPDGSTVVAAHMQSALAEAAQSGHAAGVDLLQRGAALLLEEARQVSC